MSATPSPISEEQLERARYELAHQVMGKLHWAMHNGQTCATIAKRARLSLKRVQRAFWDPTIWAEPDSLSLLASIAHAMDLRVCIDLPPREPTDDDIPF